ncbi:hypothetical protein WJ966_28715 [Achromobacter xylosoxidans]
MAATAGLADAWAASNANAPPRAPPVEARSDFASRWRMAVSSK